MTKEKISLIRDQILELVEFEETSHTYTDKISGFKYDSVSAKIKEFSEEVYSGFNISEEEKLIIMKRAAKIGNYIHKILEQHLKNEILKFPHVNDKTKSVGNLALNNFKRWIKNNNIEPLVSEIILVDREKRLAGTIDLIFNRKQKTYLCDFKTSNVSVATIKKKRALYALQLKYYQKLSEKNGIKVDGLAILFINKRTGLVNIVIVKQELSNDAQIVVEAHLTNSHLQKKINQDYIIKYIK